jgi:uncharacterized protein
MGASDRPSAAVVGSGVAGLTAAYLLQRTYDVTLYEAADRLGGHADTHQVAVSGDRLLALDTGFIVHNAGTYPTLVRLFDELGVRSQPSEMSLSVRCLGCGLEYAGSRGWRGLAPLAGQLARPEYLRLLASVPRFYRAARGLLDSPGPSSAGRSSAGRSSAGPSSAGLTGRDELTLGEFLRAGGYDRFFVQHFVTPLIAATWSCSPADALAYPARYLFEFLSQHGILSLTRSPAWRTVVGGSVSYVDRIGKQLTARRTQTPVVALARNAAGIEVVAGGERKQFAAAVVATHPDQALALLATPTATERAVLSAFSYSASQVALHTDGSVLPGSPAVRSSWNYLLADCAGRADSVQVSYYLNRLQRLSEPVDYVVTLNALDQVDPDLVIDRMSYQHPRYTRQSIAAQGRLPELNRDRLAFAGAYHGWGFHEDGCRSGVTAAATLGARW